MFARAFRAIMVISGCCLAALLWHALHGGSPVGLLVAGGGLIFGSAVVFALEFVLMRAVSARAGGTRPSWGVVARAWWHEHADAVRIYGWYMPWRSRAIPDHLPAKARGRRGVLFLHGLMCNRGLWNPWLTRLKALDHPFIALDLEPLFGEIEAYVAAVEAGVERLHATTGLPPVIVGHSMGGLAARAWLRAQAVNGAAGRVAKIITIGTPHRGTWLARFARSRNGRQMRSDGAWIDELGRSNSSSWGLFLCWWSECDQIVFPPALAVLTGAEARQIRGVGHVSLSQHEEVWKDLRERLSQVA